MTSYQSDFESLDAADPAALTNDGYRIFADVWGSATGDATVGSDVFLYPYGPFDAPNGGAGFSAVAGGEGGIDQGAQYLNIYSDYANGDQAPGGACGPDFGCTINTNVFQEFVPDPLFDPDGGIDASNIGQTWTFSFDAKSPFAGGIFDGTASNPNGGDFNNPQSASAFIKTLDPNAGYNTTNDIRVDMTNISNTDWARFSISLSLADPALQGQILQFGFNTVSTNYGDSGVYYDNVCFSSNGDDCVFAPIPVPAAVWLFGSALGLLGWVRRRVA
ncbi:MAG: VPLPA-CTERM sorting domain-containing protein [Gammaproteobacteria bacterium]